MDALRKAFSSEDIIVNFGNVDDGYRIQLLVAGMIVHDEVLSDRDAAMDKLVEVATEAREKLDSMS